MKRVWHWVRLGLGVGLIAYFCVRFAEAQAVWQTMLASRPFYLLGTVVIYFGGVGLSCFKWQLLLRSQGVRAPFWQLVQWYLLGTLANTVLPSDIGGDLGRGYLAAREYGNRAATWSSVAVERLTGLVTLVLLASLTLGLAPAILDVPAWTPLVMIVVSGVAGAAIVIVLYTRLEHISFIPQIIRRTIDHVRRVIDIYRHAPGTILACLAISVLFHALNGLSLWLLALAVEPGASASTILAWPVIGLLGIVPLTPGNIGVREGAMALLLERFGISPDQAVAAALISRVLLLLCSLAGLPTFLSHMRPSGKSAHDVGTK